MKKEDLVEPCCSGLCEALFPSGFIKESRAMLTITWPIIVTQVWQRLMAPVSMAFCGHLGDAVQLDCAALSISLINVTCISIGQGLGTACDTFFSQAYGGANKKRVGVYVQRALLIFALVLTVCVSLHVNAETLLLLCGQDVVVARMVGQYLLRFIPGAASFFMFIVLSKYLQSQNIVYPNVVIGLLTNLINALLHYILLYRLHMGTNGSAVAQACSHFFMFSMTLLYILYSRCYTKTWPGWSVECLQDWGQFSRLSFPGMFMLAMEWWGFEIGIFTAGMVGITELGAQSVLLQLDVIWFQIPLGIQIATAIRVGQYLGAGQTAEAKTVSRLSVTIVAACSLVAGAVCMTWQYQLPVLFTNVPEVIELTAKLFPIVAVYLFFDGIAISCKGTLHGTGRQFLGMLILFISYYVLALPAGITLMFLTELRTAAYWYALTLNLVLQSVVLFVIVMRTDWRTMMQQAQMRAGMIGENGIVYKPVTQQPETFRRRRLVSASLSHEAIKALTRRPGKTPPLHEVVIRRLALVAGVLCVLLSAVTLRLAAPLTAPLRAPIRYNPRTHHNATAGTMQALAAADPLLGTIDITLGFTRSEFTVGSGHLNFPVLPGAAATKFTFDKLSDFYDYSRWLEKYFSTPEIYVAPILETEPDTGANDEKYSDSRNEMDSDNDTYTDSRKGSSMTAHVTEDTTRFPNTNALTTVPSYTSARTQPTSANQRPSEFLDRLESTLNKLLDFTGSVEIAIDFRLNVFMTGNGTISAEGASTDDQVTFESIFDFALFTELMKEYLDDASKAVVSESVDFQSSFVDISLYFDKSKFQNGIAYIFYPDESDLDLSGKLTFDDFGKYYDFSVWLTKYAFDPEVPSMSQDDSATLKAQSEFLRDLERSMTDLTGTVDINLALRANKFHTGEVHVSDMDGNYNSGNGQFTFEGIDDFMNLSDWLKNNNV